MTDHLLWGAMFLNASSHDNGIAMAEVTHESAHCLLYGLSVDEPLVLNPDNEFFPSPLRQDDRPIDGIYHATFVSAHMHWAMSRLIESGQLDTGACTIDRNRETGDDRGKGLYGRCLCRTYTGMNVC